MSYIVIQDIIFFIILIGLAVLLGNYIYKVMEGKKVFLTSVFSPVEKGIYKLMDVSEDDEMDAKRYAISVLAFSAIGFLIVFLLQIFQGGLILNPEGLSGTSWHLAFNTAVSFITNTNWQAYAGENTLSYLTQSFGLGVQNFVSAATGIAVLFAFIRGFIRRESKTIGNFWRDLVKTTLYVLIPLATVFSIILVSQGVVQSLDGYKEVVTVENKETQVIPMGPVASQIAIKQLGTNGGGFFGTNSAYPLENPTPLTNMLQVISILLIPTALCFTFGRAIKDKKQGKTLFRIMLVVFIVALIAITCSEQMLGSQWKGVALSGNMEGKEIRNGIGSSALWSTATTAASNGSVNSMHDSLTPLSGLVTMFLMQIGEVVFGGVGCGLYGIIAFVILTVFIGGLMVGRTPEYIGKKIEPFDMKMVCLVILVPPLLVLLGSAITVCMPQVNSWLSNSGPHGFTEILYNFSSVAGNNGSAFAGFNANTVYMNLISGVIMILARFIPMISIIYMAGNLAKKKSVAVSDGTLDTGKNSFVILVIGIIVLVGALSFLPALALGPIAEFFITI